MNEQFFAPCPRGLSALLAGELTQLGAGEVRAHEAGCSFSGAFTLGYRVNLHSRIASRVLWQVAHFAYVREDDIYQAAFALPWHKWFGVQRTIKVEINAQHCPLKSLDFITLRIKDAVCDRFRAALGERPSVQTQDPDMRIHAFLDATHATLYLDTSGAALFKRGSRDHTGAAPLKKNLAAGILRLGGWQPGTPLLDPMCGSGTFLVEAAEIALQRAPGRGRAFAFEKLANFNAAEWQQQRNAAQDAEQPPRELAIFGSDMYGYALQDARDNIAAMGLGECIQLKQANFLEISAPAPRGVLVTNPPYGERLGEDTELAAFYPLLGDVLKRKFSGWNAYIFSGDTRLPKLIRLTASKRTPLYNGKIECRLYEFKMVAGSNRGEERST
jgi:putative N6-adenine-specific DNA methylase